MGRIGPIGLILLALAPAHAAAPTYQEVVRPLFQDSCLNCHNADKHKAGLDLSSYDATMDGSDNGKVVELGDAEKSVLLKVLTHDEEPYMPKGGDKLPDAQIDIIRQWIAANAPEKIGGAIAKNAAGPAIAVVPVETRPKGPPAMPRDGLLDPVVHTIRAGTVPSIAGSPWAPLVAIAAQKQVLLYNTDTLELAGILPFPEGFPAVVRFSHNGTLLIAGGGIGAKLGHVVIWDVVTGRRVTEVGDEFDTVLAADISPDQSLVALGGPSRLVKIFTAADGKMVCKMKKHTDWVTALCFTPDGKQLISGDRAGGMAVWDCQGHELQSLSAHDSAITGIACAGTLVATSSEDGSVKFWDIEEGKQLKTWHAQDGGVRSIAFTPDGHLLTCGRDHLVRLWDSDGNMIRQFDPLNDIAMQAVPAGGKIIAADWSGLVRVWTSDGNRVGDLDSNPPTLVQRIDAANRQLADLQSTQKRDQEECKQAAAGLAAARIQSGNAASALTAGKAALAAAQARVVQLQAQSSAAAAALQRAQAETVRLNNLAVDAAGFSAANPALQPAVFSTLTSGVLAEQSFATQKAGLAQTQSALASAQAQSAAHAGEIEPLTRANSAAASAAQAAENAVSSVQSAADKTAGEIRAANLDLLKWRTAAARIASNPQYASKSK